MSYIEKEKWEGPYITVVPATAGFYAIYSYQINQECSQTVRYAVVAWRVDDRTDSTYFIEHICETDQLEGFVFEGMQRPDGTVRDTEGGHYKSLDQFYKENSSLLR